MKISMPCCVTCHSPVAKWNMTSYTARHRNFHIFIYDWNIFFFSSNVCGQWRRRIGSHHRYSGRMHSFFRRRAYAHRFSERSLWWMRSMNELNQCAYRPELNLINHGFIVDWQAWEVEQTAFPCQLPLCMSHTLIFHCYEWWKRLRNGNMVHGRNTILNFVEVYKSLSQFDNGKCITQRSFQ